MSCGSAIAGRKLVQDRRARPHQVEEVQSVSSQSVVDAACHLEGVAALIGRFNPETCSLHGKAAEVQNMNAQAGCGLWPKRPGPRGSGVEGDSTPVANQEGDRALGIRYECRLLGSAEQVTQLVHSDLWTQTNNVGYAPRWPTHRCSLGCAIGPRSDNPAKPGQCAWR